MSEFYSYALIQEPGQIPAQEMQYESEVIDAHHDVQSFIDTTVIPRFISHPDTPKTIIFSGEPGSMKGTIAGQELLYLKHDSQAVKLAEEATHRRFTPHYLSTAMIVQEGMRAGLMQSAYGAPTSEETKLMTAHADEILTSVETQLTSAMHDPESPAMHLLLEELVAVDHTFDLGMTIVERQGRSSETGVIFIASLPAIQEREYQRRKRVWEQEEVGEKSKKTHAVFDMSDEEVKKTMGTHKSVELVTRVENIRMHRLFTEKAFSLPLQGPNKVPTEILYKNDPRDLEGQQLTDFFGSLTTFTKNGMRSNAIRPYLQAEYYEYLAAQTGLENVLVTIPRFVDSKRIHGYPGELKKHALVLAELAEGNDITLL